MKYIKILFSVIFLLSVIKCEKGIDLERDNPNDSENEKYTYSPPLPDLIFSKYEWTRYNWYSGSSSNGEFELRIYLKNIGEGYAKMVKAKVSTKNPYVLNTILGAPSFQDIQSGSEEAGFSVYNSDNYSFSFDTSPTMPKGTKITFYLDISAEQDGYENKNPVIINYNRVDSFSVVIE